MRTLRFIPVVVFAALLFGVSVAKADTAPAGPAAAPAAVQQQPAVAPQASTVPAPAVAQPADPEVIHRILNDLPPAPTPRICQCVSNAQCRRFCPPPGIPKCECVCDCL